MSSEMMKFLIVWLPTILFVVAVLGGVVVGLIRGFRKSLILTIHAAVAAIICLITYICIIQMPGLDEWGFKTINSFLSIFGTSIQECMGVSADCDSIKNALIEFIPKNMSYGDGLRLVLLDNGAYLATIVSLCYHLIFALLFYVVYFILIFILYVIYLIFYPERRYKHKKNKKYREARADKPYRKHFLFGGLVGGLRSAVVSLVGLSFLGALFFILAGGVGEKSYEDYPEYDFGDSSLNTTYDFYKVVGGYGTTGIYKVLNVLKDSNDLPFYLFAANLVLQGDLEDTEREIKENIYLTKEFGVYVNFSRKTFDLLLKYDAEGKMKEIIKGNSSEDMLDVVASIMAEDGFQEEFAEVIDDFEGGTYFINLSLSLLDSIVKHKDDLSFTQGLDENTKSILDILFTGENRIVASSLLTKEDAKALVKACVDMLILQGKTEEALDDTQKALLYGQVLLPELASLSILNDKDRAKELNPVLRELYDYFASSFSEESSLVSVSNRAMQLTNTGLDDIDWTAELKMLLESGADALKLYDRIYAPGAEFLDMVFSLFPENNSILAAENEALYDSVMNSLGSSKLFGVVLQTSYVRGMLDEMVSSFAPNARLPETIDYVNQYDAEGNLIQRGEIYHLLNTVKIFIKNDAKTVVDIFQKEEPSTEDIKLLAGLFNKTLDDGDTILGHALNSEIMRYTVSGILMDLSSSGISGITLIIPNGCKEEGKDSIILIKKDSLISLMGDIVLVLDILPQSSDGNPNLSGIDYKALITAKDTLFENDIIQATMIYYLTQYSGENTILTYPEAYTAAAGLEALKEFDTNIWKQTRELWYLMDAFDELLGISTAESFDITEALQDVLTKALSLNEASLHTEGSTKLDICYLSAVIRSTLTSQMENVLSGYIEEEVRNTITVDGVYQKEEVRSLITSLNELEITTFDSGNFNADRVKDKILELNTVSTFDKTRTKLEVMYDSIIVKNAIVKPLDDALGADALNVHTAVLDSVKETQEGVSKKIYKMTEVSKLIAALTDKGLGIAGLEDMNSLDYVGMIKELNTVPEGGEGTRLAVLYASDILKDILTVRIGDTLDANSAVVNTPEAKYALAETGVYFYEEQELKIMIDFLNSLGVESLETMDLSTVSIDENIKPYILESKILYATASKYIIENENLVVPTDCTVLITETSYQKLKDFAEMSNLIDAIISLSGGSLSSTINLTLNEEVIQMICSSLILRATITDSLMTNENVVIPDKTEVIDNTVLDEAVRVIDETELNHFLYAIYQGLGVESVDSFVIADLQIPYGQTKEERTTALTSSWIMRATITENVKSSEETLPLYVENHADFVEASVDISQRSILILSEQEIAALIDSIGYINQGTTFEIEVSFEKLLLLAEDIEKTYKTLNSNIAKILIGNYLTSHTLSVQSASVGYTSPVTILHINSNSNVDANGTIAIEGHDSYTLTFAEGMYYFTAPSELEVYNLGTRTTEINTGILTCDDIVAYLLYLKGFMASAV